ncbi:quinolinate synthase NadA [Candidatus Altiarchaeota archaeon]
MDIVDEILKLKEERNAVFLVHNYQLPEIQELNDHIGDSLGLARAAVDVEADVIVFCGVDFMAETASILNPGKKVLMPEKGALCPMAAMLPDEDIIRAKEEHPDAEVVLYVNTHASSKALADCICTSGNCIDIVNAMESDEIIFGPDKNLLYYVQKHTDKKLFPVPELGYCYTHNNIFKDHILEAKQEHPNARVVVHPETKPEVQELADEIASTEGMMRYCQNSAEKEFIIGTETGILYRMSKELPDKKFYPACESAVCDSMKFTTLDKVRDVLRDMSNQVTVEEEIASRARKAIERMLELS